MKNALRTALMIAAMTMLVACGGEKIDAKNEMAFKKSVESIAMDLPQAEARQFAEDLQVVGSELMEDMDIFNQESVQKFTDMMLKRLDGKTVKDIHKMANAIRKKS